MHIQNARKKYLDPCNHLSHDVDNHVEIALDENWAVNMGKAMDTVPTVLMDSSHLLWSLVFELCVDKHVLGIFHNQLTLLNPLPMTLVLLRYLVIIFIFEI